MIQPTTYSRITLEISASAVAGTLPDTFFGEAIVRCYRRLPTAQATPANTPLTRCCNGLAMVMLLGCFGRLTKYSRVHLRTPHSRYPPRANLDSQSIFHIQVRSSRLPESVVPTCGHDGTGLRPDWRDHVLRLWFRPCESMRRKDGHDFQALLRAVVSTGNPPPPRAGAPVEFCSERTFLVSSIKVHILALNASLR